MRWLADFPWTITTTNQLPTATARSRHSWDATRQVNFKRPLDLFLAIARSQWIATYCEGDEKNMRNIGRISASTLSYQPKKYLLVIMPSKPANLAITYRLLSPINELVDVICRTKLSTIFVCNSCDLK
jgi:hypothetical protein